MTSGRTSPVILSSADEGSGSLDLVVKLNGGMDAGTAGAVYESLASRLAFQLNISAPEPAFAFLSEELAHLMCELHPDKSDLILKSVGWNFATRLMNNLAIWPVDRTLPDSLVESAADVFAFDAMIQNPDRRFSNPNLGTQGDALRVFDHECAFAFLYNIFPNASPWILAHEQYLNDHVFATALRRKKLNWRSFAQLLREVDPAFFDQLTEELPPEWNQTRVPEITAHILLIRAHFVDFELELQRRCS